MIKDAQERLKGVAQKTGLSYSNSSLWNAKYRQPVPANTLFVDCPAMRANPFRPYFLSAIAAAIAGCRQ